MKQTIIISLLIIAVAAFLSEELKRVEWLIEQNHKSFEDFLKETVQEQEKIDAA